MLHRLEAGDNGLLYFLTPYSPQKIVMCQSQISLLEDKSDAISTIIKNAFVSFLYWLDKHSTNIPF